MVTAARKEAWGDFALKALSFFADGDTISAVAESAQKLGIETTKQHPVERDPAALKSPIGPAELQSILHTVTLVFSTGVAAVEFFSKLIDLIRKVGKPIEVRDAMTNETVAVIKSSNDVMKLISSVENQT